MKKIVLSAVAVLAMGSFAVAGGDIAPAPVFEETPGNFFVGLSYSCYDIKEGEDVNLDINDDFEAAMIQAGYKYNEYVAFEFRYWFGIEEDVFNYNTMELNRDSNADSWGIYVKPMYPVWEGLSVYGLLGYASTSFDMSRTSLDDVDGFSYGLGAEYTFENNIKLFVDYTSLYSDSMTYNDNYVDGYNFGIGYRF